MTVHMKREIDKLKKMLLSLCGVVEESLRQAVESTSKLTTWKLTSKRSA